MSSAPSMWFAACSIRLLHCRSGRSRQPVWHGFTQMISGNAWFEPGAAKTFVTIPQQMRDGGDADVALRALVSVAHRCWWTRPRPRTRQYVVDTAESIVVPRTTIPACLRNCPRAPKVTGRSVLRRIARVRLSDVADPSRRACRYRRREGRRLCHRGALSSRGLELLREQGRLGPVSRSGHPLTT